MLFLLMWMDVVTRLDASSAFFASFEPRKDDDDDDIVFFEVQHGPITMQ